MLKRLKQIDEYSDDERRSFCLYYLQRPQKLLNRLTDTREFEEQELLWLLKIELKLYRRSEIVYRVSARYNKLRRQRDWEELKGVLNGTIPFS